MAGYDERAQPGASDPGGTDEFVDDPGATMAQEAVTPPQGLAATPRRTTKTTLASIAIPRPQPADDLSVPPRDLPDSDELGADIPNEMDEEWAVSDQPTVLIAPRNPPARQAAKSRPAYLETDQYAAWPPATTPRDGTPSVRREPAEPTAPISRGTRRPPDAHGGARLASPSGKLIPPTPPGGVPRAEMPDPRMERFQELRHTRTAHEQGARAPGDPSQVAEMVRQWWADLLPGLRTSLSYQREARASGTHPLPATVPTTVSRLGDAFGRLAAGAREAAGRASAAAAPTLRKLHDQAEQAAQALIDRIEGSPVRQQAPFLGPGRIAVLFRPGVTVGQAQRLLLTAQARPLRLIPRKHGFLALVRPGSEEEIAERLRQHPYVRDVIYIEYDELDEAGPEDDYPEESHPRDSANDAVDESESEPEASLPGRSTLE
jgi:hypothetical protein